MIYLHVIPGSPRAFNRRGSRVYYHLYRKRAEEEEEEEVQPLGPTVHLHWIHLSGSNTLCVCVCVVVYALTRG